MENPSKRYLKGFNDGYFLAEHAPKVLSKLVETQNEENNIEYINALKEGKVAYENQRIRDRKRELEQGKSIDLEQEQ